MALDEEGVLLVARGAAAFVQDIGRASQALDTLTDKLSNASRVRTPQLAPDIVDAQASIARVQNRTNEYIDTLTKLGLAANTTAGSMRNKTRAENEQSDAERRGSATGISYLSTLSAIHAASFLLGGQTFTTVGSLTTLSLAFSKLGPQGIAFGATLGTIFLAVSSLSNAFQTLVNVAETALKATFAGAAAGAAAIGAAFVVAEKQAAGLEEEFALIRAITGGTDQQLGTLHDTVVSLSREFGVNQVEVATAASLYVRAGGSIEDAIGGATKAIEQLQIASKGELGAQNAARAVAQIQNAFKVGPQDAADFIVGLAQTTTLSFTEITQALQQIGPAAANLKIPLNDVGAAIGVAAQAGLRGTVAGSGLKQVLLDLEKPSAAAAKILQQFNISLFDTQGAVRPLADVFNDLNQAFGEEAVQAGRVTDAVRANALAVIFGSRAGQAAAIIAKSGAQAFLELRDGIVAVTATDVATQLLIPTSRQLEITKQNVLALAGAFGGPINAGIGLLLTNFNKLLQEISPQPFIVAGQAVVALATGQGFGQLQQKINELTSDSNLQQFLNNILTLLLNVRAGITDQIIPAFQGLGKGIQDSLAGVDFNQFFSSLSSGVRTVTGVIAGLVTAFGGLVQEIIENRDRGAQLREAVVGLATAFGTSLVGGLALAAVPMIVTVKILESIGKAVLDLLDTMGEFNNLWDVSWQLAKDSVGNFVRAVQPQLAALGEFIAALSSQDINKIIETGAKFNATVLASNAVADQGSVKKALDSTAEALQKQVDLLSDLKKQRDEIAAQPFRIGGTAQLEALDASISSTEGSIQLLRGQFFELQRQSQEKQLAPVQGPLSLVRDSIAGLRQIKQEAAASFDLATITANAEGDVKATIATNARNVVKSVFEGDESTPGFLPDAGKVQSLADKIEEIISDLGVKTSNLAEDAQNDLVKIVTNGFEKLNDAEQKFGQQIEELRNKLNERIVQIETDAAIQRGQRNFLQAFTRGQEDEARVREEGLARQEQAHQNELDHIRTARSRDQQDVERSFNIQQQIAERAYSNTAEAADIAFRRIQRARTEQLTDQQDQETKTLQARLNAEAESRNIQRELSRTTDPAQRASILQRQADARDDARFQAGQQKQLDDLQKLHRRQQQNLSDSLEDQSFARRINQQIAEFNFRLRLEVLAINFRRGLEDNATQQREFDALTELARRQGLNIDEVKFRRTQQDQLQQQQDAIDTFNRNRQIETLRQQEQEQERLAGVTFIRSRAVALREIGEQLDALGIKQEKGVRGLLDSIIDKQDDITKQANQLGIPVPANFQKFDQLTLRVLELKAALDLARQSERSLFNDVQENLFQVPRRLGVPTDLVPPNPLQTSQQATQQALNLTVGLPPSFADFMQQAFFGGLQRANQQGILNPTVVIDLNGVRTTYTPQQLLQQLQRAR